MEIGQNDSSMLLVTHTRYSKATLSATSPRQILEQNESFHLTVQIILIPRHENFVNRVKG
jgi:hypothetical protein